MRTVKSIAKNIIEKGKSNVYHLEQNKTARKFLNSLEKEKGKLSSKNVKICEEYAIDVFGDKKYSPWLFVFCAFDGVFKEGWMPDNYFGEYVVPQINGEYGKLCNRNAILGQVVMESHPIDICYFVNGRFWDKNREVLSNEKLKKSLFIANNKVVFKLENSLQGKGIFFLNEESFNIETIRRLGNGVFQEYINQHPFFSEFNPTAVATIRITTTFEESGDVRPRSGFFKFGRKNDTHCQSVSAMKIPINIKNGKLTKRAYFPDWQTTDHIPNNDVSFADRALPSFNKCLNEIKKLHKQIPFVQCIGWDLIVDNNNNVRIIELNGGHTGIAFNETVDGPGFKDLNWESIGKNK